MLALLSQLAARATAAGSGASCCPDTPQASDAGVALPVALPVKQLQLQ